MKRHSISAGSCIPIGTLRDLRPLLFRTAEKNVHKTCAILEGIIVDQGYARRDDNTLKACASIERIVTDRGHFRGILIEVTGAP